MEAIEGIMNGKLLGAMRYVDSAIQLGWHVEYKTIENPERDEIDQVEATMEVNPYAGVPLYVYDVYVYPPDSDLPLTAPITAEKVKTLSGAILNAANAIQKAVPQKSLEQLQNNPLTK